MTALEILKGAREFLADPAHWRQGGFANYTNISAGLAVENVCEVCLDGALYYAAGMRPGSDKGDFPIGLVWLLNAAQWCVAKVISARTLNQNYTLWTFNDDKNRQHHEILEVLDKAIAVEEAAA